MPLFQPERLDAPVLSQFSLKGKVVIVTGGSRGIGLQIVLALAEAGADVAFIYNTSINATETAENIAPKTAVRVDSFKCDVRNSQLVADTFKDIVKNFGRGRLDVVVGNAGVCVNFSSFEYTEETLK